MEWVAILTVVIFFTGLGIVVRDVIKEAIDILPHAEAWGFFWYLPPLRESYTKRLSLVLPCWLDCGMCDGRVTRAMLAFASLTRTLRKG